MSHAGSNAGVGLARRTSRLPCEFRISRRRCFRFSCLGFDGAKPREATTQILQDSLRSDDLGSVSAAWTSERTPDERSGDR
jgi:hypothetical protein